ncbi:hypothetical protein L484_004609 [Morus notabilis]|uniref:Vacuolar protein sorting-associated protein 62 n=1 Tax=Morus notabilis TaxID=981085 RepID=W9SHE4_9ROSA|nr:uncharacterized protein LOC21388107 [Morus notabilis]EXC32127.1 hypothetical protein L484_004609 [Morus notabilis]
MGNANCLAVPAKRDLSKKRKPLPIDSIFKLPSAVPSLPPGDGFASGRIGLGGIQVCQISTFYKVWATHEGGPGNLGATFFEPSPIPEGFHMLGCYSQPNNKPLFGWALAAKDDSGDESTNGSALSKPVDYSLVWSSESLKIKQDNNAYVWLPTPPDGYKAVGVIITESPQKPPLEKVRCVRTDLTEPCEMESWIWGPGKESDANGFNVYTLRPTNRGTQALGVAVGTFSAQIGGTNALPPSMACLRNANNSNKVHSSMPNLAQIEAIFRAYAPLVYFHPDEKYLPSSVTWYFTNGALLYKRGEESNPTAVAPTGSNLPQGGANDGEYWLDLPKDEKEKDRVKRGDLSSAQVYLHAKPMFGSTFTDIAVWVFYPFNGPARAKVGVFTVGLGKIGEHIGDWEHMTLRVSNFNGELWKLYLSEHSKGTWVEASELEFSENNGGSGGGGKRPVAYASLSGHALYAKPGTVMQGNGVIGIRNDTAKSKIVMDTGAKFEVAAAEYLAAAEPPWVNYLRKWGPKIDYDTKEEAEKVEKMLPGRLKTAFKKFIDGLPNEFFGEDGPTGPKVKANWIGDEET